MRYVYQEPVITTVTDDEMVNDDEIRKVLETVKEMGHSVQITMEDPGNPEYIKNFDNARITAVREGSVDIHAFFNGASVRHREVPFHNLRKVRLVASRQILGKKYRVTRWHQMDVAEIE
jgi:hypothetical protein